MSVLLQRLVVAATQGRTHLDLDEVARLIFPGYWVHFSVQARRDTIAQLKRAAAHLSRGDLNGFIRVEGGNSIPHRVVIVDSPVSADPRGAPQRWQALARRAARDLGREGPSIVERQPQMSLDDLAIDVEIGGRWDDVGPDELSEGNTDDDA